MSKLTPVHPGEILKEEFIVPMGLNAAQVAARIFVPAGRITDIINNKRTITADTAIRLSKLFGTTPNFWLNLQLRYDLHIADKVKENILSIV